MNALVKLGIAAVAAIILLSATLFVVPQTQQVLVLQFGEIKRVIREPGLNAKIPFIQNTLFFDKRILDFKAQPNEFITKNRDVEERVVIDAFVRYRITDPEQFYRAVKTEANLNSRLNSIVLSSMRRVLANHSLGDLLSSKRREIMNQIQRNVNAQAQSVAVQAEDAARGMRGFGIEVVDVRIMRADLPADISQSTYERMRKDFTKEAQRFRAEGEERALAIRSAADREKTEILANARKSAETIRGEGDAEAARISAAAYGRDPSFYKFYRSMQAYRRTLGTGDTTLVLTPSGEFLDELNP